MKAAPLAIELLLTDDQRRPLSAVERVIAFRERIASPDPRLDDIDLEMEDDLTIVDPYEVHGPSRRSDKDLGEFLNLLDSLETGNDRKEITL